VTTIVMEIYEALKAAGIDDEVAKAAAKAVIGVQEKEHLATKLDIQQLRTDMADLKVELIKWNVGTLITMTGIFAAIVKLL
jgi:hypothetical protein